MEPVRVAYVNTTLSLGGATETVLLAVGGLRTLGYETTIIAGPPIAAEGGLLAETAQAGFRVELLESLQRDINPITDGRAFFDLLRAFRRGRYHVVHTHGSKAGILGRLAARVAGVPIVVHTYHALPFLESDSARHRFPYIFSERIAARWTSRIFSVSADMIRRGVAEGIAPSDRFEIVRSGVVLDPFLTSGANREAVRRTWCLGERDVALGIIGRVYAGYKGQDLLVDLAPRLRDLAPDARIVIVGSGPLVEPLTEQVRRNGLVDRVVFAGSYPPEAMPDVISALDIVILASTHEGLPRVFVQALACRKPSISYDLDGSPEVVRDGENGRLVPPGDRDALLAAIVDLANDESRRRAYGDRGPAAVDPEFRAETMVRVTDAAYRRLLRAQGLPVPAERELPPVSEWDRPPQPIGV